MQRMLQLVFDIKEFWFSEEISESGEQSDSEGEEKGDGKKTQLQLDDWLTFNVDAEVNDTLYHKFSDCFVFHLILA